MEIIPCPKMVHKNPSENGSGLDKQLMLNVPESIQFLVVVHPVLFLFE